MLVLLRMLTLVRLPGAADAGDEAQAVAGAALPPVPRRRDRPARTLRLKHHKLQGSASHTSHTDAHHTFCTHAHMAHRLFRAAESDPLERFASNITNFKAVHLILIACL